MSHTFIFFSLYKVVVISRHKFSYPQCICQDHLCCLYASSTLLSIYYCCQVVNIWHTLADLAITGNIWCCFTRSNLVCDVPPTRNVNFDAEDGNSASKFITWLQSDTYFFSTCNSSRQKTFLQPQTKQCLLPMSCDASKYWSAFKPGQHHHWRIISITDRTFMTNSCLQCSYSLFLTNNLLRIKIIFCHSLIHITAYRFFPQHFPYVYRCR